MRLICWSILAICVGAVGLSVPSGAASPAVAWASPRADRTIAGGIRPGLPTSPERSPLPASILPDFDPEPRGDDEVGQALAAGFDSFGQILLVWSRPIDGGAVRGFVTPPQPWPRAFPIRC